ncbi:MAG: outer membrane beta-barrel protein [Sphingobium sp.]
MRRSVEAPRRGSRAFLRALTLLGLGMAQAAQAQTVEEDGRQNPSVLDLERPGYEPRKLKLGDVMLSPELDVGATYNSNIYAAHADRRDDLVTSIQPRVTIQKDEGRFQWLGELSADIRRYASNSRENSESYGAAGTFKALLSQTMAVSGTAGYRRAVENRADPEVRQNPTLGPPLFDVLNGEIQFNYTGSRLGFSLKGEVEKYDFVSSLNDDRAFTSYRGTARLSYRLSPMLDGFVQAYVNQRDFRLREPISGVSRDGRTIGGMAGVQINPAGKLHGEIGAGVFHYKPESALFRSFSGFALQGSLVYSPRQRTALVLDLFSGDVATVRNGASGRIDRSARLTVQQEIRHNLIASAVLRYRQTRYRGIDSRLNTFTGGLDLEYLLNRHIAVALTGEFAKRTGGTYPERFERSRAGITLRFRY